MYKTKLAAEVAARNALNCRINDALEPVRAWFARLKGQQFWTKAGHVLAKHKPGFDALRAVSEGTIRLDNVGLWAAIFSKGWGSGSSIWIRFYSRAEYSDFKGRAEPFVVEESFRLGDVVTATGILESVQEQPASRLKTDYSEKWVGFMRAEIAKQKEQLRLLRAEIQPFNEE